MQVWIWKDRWILRSLTFMIQTPPKLQDPEAKVNDLIDPDTLVGTPASGKYFSKEEAQLILSIPVSVTNQADVCIWGSTSNGMFTIRSAYYLHMEMEKRELAGSSSPQATQCGEEFSVEGLP